MPGSSRPGPRPAARQLLFFPPHLTLSELLTHLVPLPEKPLVSLQTNSSSKHRTFTVVIPFCLPATHTLTFLSCLKQQCFLLFCRSSSAGFTRSFLCSTARPLLFQNNQYHQQRENAFSPLIFNVEFAPGQTRRCASCHMLYFFLASRSRQPLHSGIWESMRHYKICSGGRVGQYQLV